MEQVKLIQMQEEDDAPPAGVYVVIDQKGKPHFGGMGKAADYLGCDEWTLRNLVLAALAWRVCWGAMLAGVRAMERSIGAPDAETRTTPEEEP